MEALATERLVLVKTYYRVTCDITVEAGDDDNALWMVQDACKLYPGVEFTRWIFIEADERESHDNNNN